MILISQSAQSAALRVVMLAIALTNVQSKMTLYAMRESTLNAPVHVAIGCAPGGRYPAAFSGRSGRRASRKNAEPSPANSASTVKPAR